MSEPAEQTPPPDASETEIDAVLAEFGDDPRAAISALLHDLTLIVGAPRPRSRAAMSAADCGLLPSGACGDETQR